LSISLAQRIVAQSDAVWITLTQLAVPTKGIEEPVGLLRRTEGNQSNAMKELMRILRDAAATRRPAS
jgi:hypothetical protein